MLTSALRLSRVQSARYSRLTRSRWSLMVPPDSNGQAGIRPQAFATAVRDADRRGGFLPASSGASSQARPGSSGTSSHAVPGLSGTSSHGLRLGRRRGRGDRARDSSLARSGSSLIVPLDSEPNGGDTRCRPHVRSRLQPISAERTEGLTFTRRISAWQTRKRCVRSWSASRRKPRRRCCSLASGTNSPGRPWQPPARHWPAPQWSPLIGGRDEQAGGTWPAVHPELLGGSAAS